MRIFLVLDVNTGGVGGVGQDQTDRSVGFDDIDAVNGDFVKGLFGINPCEAAENGD